MSENVKQVIVIRKDLNMRKGKQISQGSHASMKVFLDLCEYQRISSDESRLIFYLDDDKSDWSVWLNGLFTKVVVSCDSEQELLDLYQQAKDKGLPCSLIIDAGLTEFNGVPTKTCVAIGPAKSEEINPITGHLKLL
jgi:peptidyl-tRNA hydrolase, PTH2 family